MRLDKSTNVLIRMLSVEHIVKLRENSMFTNMNIFLQTICDQNSVPLVQFQIGAYFYTSILFDKRYHLYMAPLWSS
jgi:hypothetical protein